MGSTIQIQDTPSAHRGQLSKYKNLTDAHDIRLLRILNEEGSIYPLEGIIKGELTHKSLDQLALDPSAPSYFAISYCWGDPTPTDRVWISDDVYIPLTDSAAYILRRVKRGIYLWIDSVCINQHDMNEKARQVRMMWGVYKYAKQVMIWLGGPEDDAELAMNLLFDVANAIVTEEFTGRKPVYLPTGSLPSFNFHYDAPSWIALAKLLERPWFRRVWVMQEVVAAKQAVLVCGQGIPIGWDELTKFIEHLHFWGELRLLDIRSSTDSSQRPCLPRGIAAISRINSLMRQDAREDNIPRNSLQENLIITANAEATNPRDKIFAILSMSRSIGVPQLLPRYDYTERDTFTQVTRYLAVNDQSLLVLHLAGIGWTTRRSPFDLPTWVPDYGRTQRGDIPNERTHILGNIAREATYSAASFYFSDLPASMPVDSRQRYSISIESLIVDEIETVCEGLSPDIHIWRAITSKDYTERWHVVSWFNGLRRHIYRPLGSSKSHSHDKSSDHHGNLSDLWRTLIANVMHHAEEPWASSISLDMDSEGAIMFDAFQTLLLHVVVHTESDPKLDQLSSGTLKEAKRYVRALDYLSTWTVFRTRKGYIGRGPPFVKKGDHVCLFKGSRTPFVVRRSVSALFGLFAAYELVGECYVHGLMHREAMYMSPLRWRSLVLI